MNRAWKFVAAISILILIVSIPIVASAKEWFIDLYLGAGMIQDADIEATVERDQRCFFVCTGPPPGSFSASEKSSFDTSPVWGGRVGYWLDVGSWSGISLDLSSFKTKSESVELKVTPLSILWMVRWPLVKSETFPSGRLQPYIRIGPALIISRMSVDYRPMLPEKLSANVSDFGYNVHAGALWQWHRHHAVFWEYRYTRIPVHYIGGGGLFSVESIGIDAHLNAHYLLLGSSIRF